MCFIVDWNDSKPRIAQEDKVCYKFMEYINRDGLIVSPYRGFYYEVNKVYNLDKPLLVSHAKIQEGFHTFTKFRIAWENGRGYIIVKCVIPKGSTYYMNNHTETYVSDSLIIKEVIPKENY